VVVQVGEHVARVDEKHKGAFHVLLSLMGVVWFALLTPICFNKKNYHMQEVLKKKYFFL
jgi:hypothetical protein